MKIKLSVNTEVLDDNEELADRVAGIVQAEARKFTAALVDRLEAEGVTNVEFESFDDSEE